MPVWCSENRPPGRGSMCVRPCSRGHPWGRKWGELDGAWRVIRAHPSPTRARGEGTRVGRNVLPCCGVSGGCGQGLQGSEGKVRCPRTERACLSLSASPSAGPGPHHERSNGLQSTAGQGTWSLKCLGGGPSRHILTAATIHFCKRND